ncbi:hypothetical protein FRB90_000273 [Tulasnella sp. 427]|nr:hypothetical protein FRB90_000273 [Tulasnella sp. 427]
MSDFTAKILTFLKDLDPEPDRTDAPLVRWAERIVVSYTEGHRWYHTLEHLEAMWTNMETGRQGFDWWTSDQEIVLRLAILFHDIIYDPRGKANEEKSNDLFQDFAREVNLRPRSSYEEYAKAIREEYIHVSDSDFKSGLDLDDVSHSDDLGEAGTFYLAAPNSDPNSCASTLMSTNNEQRYFENQLQPLPADDETLEQAFSKLREAILVGIRLIERNAGRQSSDRRRDSVYTGSAGIALMYMRLGIQGNALDLPEETLSQLPGLALSHLPSYISGQDPRPGHISPLDSHVGPCILLILHELRHPKSIRNSAWNGAIINFKAAVDLAIKDTQLGGDEVLYGKAGLLWGMLNVRAALAEGLGQERNREELEEFINDDSIRDLVENIVEDGKAGAEDYKAEYGREGPELAWPWHGKYYLGASLGGILTILLQCPRAMIKPHYEAIVSTITALLQIASYSGHLPASLPARRRSDPHVQICHGSPGLLLLLDTFRGKFPSKYLSEWRNTEAKVSYAVWEEGLVTKGLGLCHGVSGNAWPWLLTAHMEALTEESERSGSALGIPEDPDRLSKALTFLIHSTELPPIVQEPLLPYRTPDNPYSLFEGLAGAICAWADACLVIKTWLSGKEDAGPVLGVPGLGGMGPAGVIKDRCPFPKAEYQQQVTAQHRTAYPTWLVRAQSAIVSTFQLHFDPAALALPPPASYPVYYYYYSKCSEKLFLSEMSSLAFLATELQVGPGTQHPKRSLADEVAAEKSLTILRANPEQNASNLSRDGPQSEELLKPIFMGCSTRNAKVVAISIGSLQRLIGIRAVPGSMIPAIVSIMGDSLSQGVDIQLKVLQALLSLLTNYPDVHDELLGDALLLCFRLQDSRIAVVSSTAAATLRQLVMFVFDKVVDLEKPGVKGPEMELVPTPLPDGSTESLHPSVKDAFSVFEDLCLLANSEKPNFLKLQSLPKTFALELIESVLTNYHALFRKRPEFLLLLRHHLCPMLLKSLSDRPLFPLTLRSTRVVFLLLKQFCRELETEAEVFLMLLVKIISGDGEGEGSGARPGWMRVLAMEIMRGLCSDAELLRAIWDQYDARPETSSRVFSSLVSALKRLATERPSLLGVGVQMSGIGVQAHSIDSPGGAAAYGLEVAGRVASVATATVSNVVGMSGPESGLSVATASMKLQCIDQLDKADSPVIPDSYIYLLALHAIALQRPRAAGDAVITAPPALDLSALPDTEATTRDLRIVGAMVESGWPGLLSALSFYITTNLSDDLFADSLTAIQNLTNVAGVLGLRTPRDAFLTSLSKFAIPPGVVSSVDTYVEPPVPRTASVSDALGFTGLTAGPTQVPGLSERNLACLKSIISTAMYLAGSLGPTWFDILEVLQNADYVMTLKGTKGAQAPSNRRLSVVPSGGTPRPSRIVSATNSPNPAASPGTSQPVPRHPLLSDLDPETIQLTINRLYDGTKNLDDEAFKDFVASLCRLSHEMVGMQASKSMELRLSESTDEIMTPNLPSGLSPSSSGLSPMIGTPKSSRRVSGMGVSKPTRAGDYGIARLGDVALLNIHRLIYRNPDVAWTVVTNHLLDTLQDPETPHPIRLQAAEVLDEILAVVPRNISSVGNSQGEVQGRVINVLSQQVLLEGHISNLSVVIDIKKLGLETLHKILQSSGHSLVVGWEAIFDMLGSVCQPLVPKASPLGSPSTPTVINPKARLTPLSVTTSIPKSAVILVRIAFQSLTLVCESLDSLTPEQLRLCIRTLGQFGRQQETNIALTAAESLLWGVSDSIQAKRKDVEKEPVYSSLWTFLLLELQELCNDSRPEVRNGAIQTLFRTLQLYGATLSLETWDDVVWKVILPLLDTLSISVKQSTAALIDDAEPATPTPATTLSKNPWDESKSLTLQSIGAVIADFLVSKIMYLETFPKAWDAFVSHVTDSVLHDVRSVSTASLRCLERGLKASSNAGKDLALIVAEAWERTWVACDTMGDMVAREREEGPQRVLLPFTQECLQAFVEVVALTYSLSGKDWELDRIKRLLAILKAVVTYSSSRDYRPDIDALSPLQASVLEAIAGVQLSVPGSPSALISDVAEYSTLAFLAAFEYEEQSLPGMAADRKRPTKRVTYIALAKKTMPMLLELYMRFKDVKDIYEDGTIETVFSAFSIPMKLKYDAPAPSKFGSDPPLWKTATTNFLDIAKEAAKMIEVFRTEITSARLEGIWRQLLDVYKGGLLADWCVKFRDSVPESGVQPGGLPRSSPVEAMSLEAQSQEEQFDLALLNSLEIDIVPRIGDSNVPDDLIVQLGKTLQIASRIHDLDLQREAASSSAVSTPRSSIASPTEGNGKVTKAKAHGRSESKDFKGSGKVNGHVGIPDGGTSTGKLLPRERFSFWCFDLLFLICSDVVQEHKELRKRVAALVLPSLLSRCHSVLANYVADARLRGNLPFPRAQEEELIYVLRKMLELKLWNGSLWAALSAQPSKNATTQPDVDPTLRGAALVADAVRRSSKAHLYHFYGVLCEVASMPGSPPSVWVEEGQEGGSELKDARQLSRQALKEIGKEMGAYETIKHTIQVARANPVLADFVTYWMLDCQKARADHDAQHPPSSLTLSDAPSIVSQISVLSITSKAVTVVGQHLLCEFERVHYYNGVSVDPPELVYRSNLDTVEFKLPVPGQQNFFEVPFKTAEGVLGTPIIGVWDDVAPLIATLFKSSGIKHSAFHPARFSTLDEDRQKIMGPLVIWVATHPGTTTPEMARDVSPAVLSILVDHGIEGAVIEWIEGKVEPMTGPALMPTVENTNPTHNIRHPFTATHGMSIVTEDREDEDATGTVSIFFHEGGDSDKVLGASCKHVFHAETKSDYKLGGSGNRHQQIRVNGMRKFQRALASIKYKVDANVTDVVALTEDIARLEKEPKSDDEEVAADKEEALDKKKGQLTDLTKVGTRLRDFFKTITRDWTDIARRNIGYLDWAPSISIDVDEQLHYIRDMGAFFLYAEKFVKNFVGNMVDLGIKYTRHELNTIFGGKFPSDMKLRLRGTLNRQELSNPNGVDEFGNARMIVGKDGSTTELTWGNFVGVEAYLCDEFGHESKELAIYNGSKNDRSNFSGKGDSGAPIWTVDGKIVGFLHSGMPKRLSNHVTYATPGWWYLKLLLEQYPNANFWGEKWDLKA